jgi:hypothetical protein
VRAFELILHEHTWNALSATVGADRRRLLVILDELKAAPLRVGDFQQRDSTGRLHEVALVGVCLITWWIDHAAAEIRVVGIERAED